MRGIGSFMHKLGLAFLLILLSACQTQPDRMAGPDRVLLPPAGFGGTLILNQQLLVTKGETAHALDVLLEITPTHIRLAGFSAAQKVLTVDYDGKTLAGWKHPLVPAVVTPASILENITLTFWPIAVLQQQLPAGWRVEDEGNQRTFYKDGVLYLQITYQAAIRWQGKIRLISPVYHYQIDIQSAEVSS